MTTIDEEVAAYLARRSPDATPKEDFEHGLIAAIRLISDPHPVAPVDFSAQLSANAPDFVLSSNFINSPGLEPGDLVWYAPVTGGPLFSAVVHRYAFMLGDSWVIAVKELPEEYRAHCGVTHSHVTAYCDNVFRRDPADTREAVAWKELFPEAKP